MDMDTEIRAILAQYVKLVRPVDEIGPTTDLFSVGLDSQAVVNVMLAIEERFAFEFPEDRLNRESFATIAAMRDVVETAGVFA